MSEFLASQLYAQSQGAECQGSFECFWCSAPCHNTWHHTEAPPMIGIKRRTIAKRPGNPFICCGCWLWRRKRLTVRFLEGGYKDVQAPENHSWFITPELAYGIRKESHQKLYDLLLDPPPKFVLSLLTEESISNLLQSSICNNNTDIQTGTSLNYTINNVPHTYTVYELTHALKHEPEGTDPGVQSLVRILGPYKAFAPDESEEKRGRGRPIGAYLPDGRSLQKPVKKKA